MNECCYNACSSRSFNKACDENSKREKRHSIEPEEEEQHKVGWVDEDVYL